MEFTCQFFLEIYYLIIERLCGFRQYDGLKYLGYIKENVN